MQKRLSDGLDVDDLALELEEGTPLEDYLPYLLFRIVNRLALNLRQDLRPMKMTMTRWRTLSVLSASDGRRMGELAAHTVIEQAALSRVIDQMERDGLVTRKPAEEDSRVVRVYLTAAGRRMFEEIRPLELGHYAQAIAGMDAVDLEQLSELLHRFWENVDG
jgi:DNA-binding MarR family transcriptional regulator